MTSQVSAKVDLSRIPLFEGIDECVIAVHEDWLSYYHEKQNIYVRGEPADSLIVILHGQAEILSQDIFLVTRRASDVVGEQGFLAPDERRTATVVARGTVQALCVPRAEVERLLATSHQFTRNLLRIVSAKLAEATSEREFRYRNEHRLIAAFNSHLAPEITGAAICLRR
jgi:CRP-like cAMP-binding protein